MLSEEEKLSTKLQSLGVDADVDSGYPTYSLEYILEILFSFHYEKTDSDWKDDNGEFNFRVENGLYSIEFEGGGADVKNHFENDDRQDILNKAILTLIEAIETYGIDSIGKKYLVNND